MKDLEMAPIVPTRTRTIMDRMRKDIDRITDAFCRISTTCMPNLAVYRAEDNALARFMVVRHQTHPGWEAHWDRLDPALLDRLVEGFADMAHFADRWVTADQAVTSGLMARFIEASLRVYRVAEVSVDPANPADPQETA